MTESSDNEKWLPEAKVLNLSGLSRSTLRSWGEAGLECASAAGYDLDAVVAIVLLAECREYLSPKELVGAWRRLTKGGEGGVVKAAEELQPGERFDLVIDSTYSSIAVVQSDAELSEAVRRKKPRAMIVKDVAEQISEAVENFEYHANEGSVPTKKGPGRPRSAERGLRLVDSGAGG